MPTSVEGPSDVIIDAAAAYRWSQWRSKLAPGGTFVTTLPSLNFAVDKMASLFTGTRVSFVNVKSRAADLQQLAGWLTEGLEVPIDQTVPLRDLATALEKLRSGRVLGRIAVDVEAGIN